MKKKLFFLFLLLIFPLLSHGFSPCTLPSLGVQKTIRAPGCHRTFTVRGKTYPLDSYHQKNGNQLALLFQDTPQAQLELKAYQNTLQSHQWLTYSATGGFLLALFSSIFAQLAPKSSRTTTQSILLLGGLSIGVGSFLYHWSVLKTNESHLERGAKIYQQKHPEQKFSIFFQKSLF